MSDPLKNISPLDGRYSKSIGALSDYFSESALIKYRIKVEIEYLIHLSRQKEVKELDPISDKDVKRFQKLYNSFSIQDAKRVKAIEVATNHDVKVLWFGALRGKKEFGQWKIARIDFYNLISQTHPMSHHKHRS